jgi:hypothetical protein
VPYRFIGWKMLDLHRAQVRISSRGPVFSEPFYPTWDLHSSKTKKKVEAKRLSRPGGTISKLVGTENSNIFLILCFMSYVAHQFVHVKFRKLNICCCFLQAVAVENIKTSIQFSKLDMNKLMSQGPRI